MTSGGTIARMRKMVTAAALILALAAGVAKGDIVRNFYSGDALLSLCQASDSNFCMGYIAGIADAVTSGPVSGWRACIPISATVEQVRDVVVGFLTAHPENRHFAALSLGAAALAGAFPCK
jgi:hypothetical protein